MIVNYDVLNMIVSYMYNLCDVINIYNMNKESQKFLFKFYSVKKNLKIL